MFNKLSDQRDIEHNELKKNALIEQFEKITEAQRYTSEKNAQNIKINNLITLYNQIITMKECLYYKLEKYLHKIKTVFQKTIKL